MMVVVYALKALCLGVLWATTELIANGQCGLALAAVPTLLTLWYVTRQRQRALRRARNGVGA
jgi:hypothetical protein